MDENKDIVPTFVEVDGCKRSDAFRLITWPRACADEASTDTIVPSLQVLLKCKEGGRKEGGAGGIISLHSYNRGYLSYLKRARRTIGVVIPIMNYIKAQVIFAHEVEEIVCFFFRPAILCVAVRMPRNAFVKNPGSKLSGGSASSP